MCVSLLWRRKRKTHLLLPTHTRSYSLNRLSFYPSISPISPRVKVPLGSGLYSRARPWRRWLQTSMPRTRATGLTKAVKREAEEMDITNDEKRQRTIEDDDAQSSNESETPTADCSETLAVDSTETLAVDCTETPTADCSEILAVDSTETLTVDCTESPTADCSETPAVDLETSTADCKNEDTSAEEPPRELLWSQREEIVKEQEELVARMYPMAAGNDADEAAERAACLHSMGYNPDADEELALKLQESVQDQEEDWESVPGGKVPDFCPIPGTDFALQVAMLSSMRKPEDSFATGRNSTNENEECIDDSDCGTDFGFGTDCEGSEIDCDDVELPFNEEDEVKTKWGTFGEYESLDDAEIEKLSGDLLRQLQDISGLSDVACWNALRKHKWDISAAFEGMSKDEQVEAEPFEKIVQDMTPEEKEQFHKVQREEFVASHPQFTACPDCKRAVRVPRWSLVREMVCPPAICSGKGGCQREFCFSCKEDLHEPASCAMMAAWVVFSDRALELKCRQETGELDEQELIFLSAYDAREELLKERRDKDTQLLTSTIWETIMAALLHAVEKSSAEVALKSARDVMSKAGDVLCSTIRIGFYLDPCYRKEIFEELHKDLKEHLDELTLLLTDMETLTEAIQDQQAFHEIVVKRTQYVDSRTKKLIDFCEEGTKSETWAWEFRGHGLK